MFIFTLTDYVENVISGIKIKKTFRIEGRKVTIYSRRKKEPLTKKKKSENDLIGKFVIILLFIGMLLFFSTNFIFSFHDIDLAYNYKDYPLDHYNLFNNESRTSNELYSSGWEDIFYAIFIYNVFCIMLISYFIIDLVEGYHKFKKRFK